MAEVLAGVAVVGGVSTAVNWISSLWDYNRENFAFDRGQEQAAMYQQQGMRMNRYGQYREDIRELFTLVYSKIGVYLTISTLNLGFVIGMFYLGRLPGPEDFEKPDDHNPFWMTSLYGLCLSATGLAFVISIYLSVTAWMQAQSYCVRILTQHLRIPVPTDADVMAAASRYKEFESDQSQMRIPYVNTAGKVWFNKIQAILRGDHDDEEERMREHETMTVRKLPSRESHHSLGTLRPSVDGSHQEEDDPYRTRKYYIENERGEHKQIHTHRFMGVSPDIHNKLGPSLLVVEDLGHRAVPVKLLPHIRMFRHLQGMWQPYDAYARVCMVLGTVMLCLSLVHFGNIWYVRQLHEFQLGLVFTAAWTAAAIIVVCIEITIHNLAEYGMIGFIIASMFLSYFGALADEVIRRDINNGTTKDTYWSLTTGVIISNALGLGAYVCHVGFCFSFLHASRALDIPGFIKHLPHNFRNVHVIDVFAPMNNVMKKAIKSNLVYINPATKKKVKDVFATSRSHTQDDLSMYEKYVQENADIPPEFDDSIINAVHMRDHIAATMHRLFHNPNLRCNPKMSEIAEKFQREWNALTPLIPRRYPQFHQPSLGFGRMNSFGDNTFDHVSTKSFSSKAMDKLNYALEKQVAMFSKIVKQLDKDIKAKQPHVERGHKERMSCFGPKRKTRDKLEEDSDEAHYLSQSEDCHARSGSHHEHGLEDEKMVVGDKDDDTHTMAIAKRAFWDPPRAHIIFACVMYSICALYTGTCGYYVSIVARYHFDITPWKIYDPEDAAAEARLRGLTALPGGEYPQEALRRRLDQVTHSRGLLGELNNWRVSPRSEGVLIGCSDKDVYFNSEIDFAIGSRAPTDAPTDDASDAPTYVLGPTCGNNMYDAMAIAGDSIYVVHFDKKTQRNYMSRCIHSGDRKVVEYPPEPIHRLPHNDSGKIVSIDFEIQHETMVAALANGSYVVITRKGGQLISERELGTLEGLSQISVEPIDEASGFEFRRLLLVAENIVYQASFSPTASIGDYTMGVLQPECLHERVQGDRPTIHPRFQQLNSLNVKSIKFCTPPQRGDDQRSSQRGDDQYPQHAAAPTVDNTTTTVFVDSRPHERRTVNGERRRQVAVQIQNHWWVTDE